LFRLQLVRKAQLLGAFFFSCLSHRVVLVSDHLGLSRERIHRVASQQRVLALVRMLISVATVLMASRQVRQSQGGCSVQ
jgi:hypothetical protein